MATPLPDALIPMDLFARRAPVRIDIVYANPVHARNIFARALYHPQARLWLHEDLAAIVLRAAARLHALYGWTTVLKDGLRTVEAQAMMQDTDIVKANPHWSGAVPEKRLLSSPGNGAHPRGMAIDVGFIDGAGREVDMGTPFDFFTPDPDNNPAARAYTKLGDAVIERRRIVEDVFMTAAASLDLGLVPLASEWWDYRFPADLYNQFPALRDADLPEWMQMTGRPHPIMPDDIQAAFDKRAETLLNALDEHLQIAS